MPSRRKRSARKPAPRRRARAQGLDALVAESPAMRRAVEQAARVAAAARAPLLIEGEWGAGKGAFARAIHESGPRAAAPFVHVECDALRDEAAEDELFGAAATGGAARKAGRFEEAEGGTLFVDEVAALPGGAQAALLRALHDRGFVPRGAGQTRRADVRVMASTTRDLGAEAAAGRFRADLAERLGVVRVRVPALRERREDLPRLASQIAAEILHARGKRPRALTPGLIERLAAHAWPGNLRELRSTLEAVIAAAGSRGPLSVTDLPEGLRSLSAVRGPVDIAVGMTMREAERRLMAATLEHVGGDKPRAAALLGIGLRTLYRKIREFGLA